MREDERFDPSRHSLADAAVRLKQISEKDYTSRLAEVLGRHEEENTGGSIPPVPELTENRVREIFREELARWQANKAEVSKLVNTIGAEIGRQMKMLPGRSRNE